MEVLSYSYILRVPEAFGFAADYLLSHLLRHLCAPLAQTVCNAVVGGTTVPALAYRFQPSG